MSDSHPAPFEIVHGSASSSVYARLQALRVTLYKSKIQKSGIAHPGVAYYQLADFLPRVMDACISAHLCGVMSFTRELATLTIVDSLDPQQQIVFTMPVTGTVDSKLDHHSKTSPMQLTGADQSYLRRYLWRQALEFVESDYYDTTVSALRAEISRQIALGDIKKALNLFTTHTEKGSDLRADVWSMLDKSEQTSLKSIKKDDDAIAQ
jgi:hypothetical protein